MRYRLTGYEQLCMAQYLTKRSTKISSSVRGFYLLLKICLCIYLIEAAFAILTAPEPLTPLIARMPLLAFFLLLGPAAYFILFLSAFS